MEQKFKNLLSKLSLFFILAVSSLSALAQDNTGSGTKTVTKTETSSTNFHVEPWMWIVGGVVLIVLLIALLGGRSSSVKETTIIKER